MALLRAVGVACRFHRFTIDKALQKGAITGVAYRLAPRNIIHSWVEIWSAGQWIRLEGFILDRTYLRALQRRFVHHRGPFCGYGVATPNLKKPPVDWVGKDTFIQKDDQPRLRAVRRPRRFLRPAWCQPKRDQAMALYALHPPRDEPQCCAHSHHVMKHTDRLWSIKLGCYTRAGMRRLFILFILVLLPIQFVWGSAAQYCTHESSSQTSAHFGHHSHAHEGSDEATKTSGFAASLGTVDGDCASCHLGTASGLLGEVPTMPPLSHVRSLSDHVTLYQSHIPLGLERPDRSELNTAARFGGGVEFCPLQL